MMIFKCIRCKGVKILAKKCSVENVERSDLGLLTAKLQRMSGGENVISRRNSDGVANL
jgi:hypothetical protein